MRSIKWRFVAIYFMLVLAVLIIVATSITNRLEANLIQDKIDNVKTQIASMVTTGGYFRSADLQENIRGIRASLTERRFQNDEEVFVLSDRDFLTILAAKTNRLRSLEGARITSVEDIRMGLVKSGYQGETRQEIVRTSRGQEAHIVVPIIGKDAEVKGLVYAILDLTSIDATLNRTSRIILDSGIIALIVTAFLSYMIARGITGPIRQVTEVAKRMSQGDFKQRVAIKSRDEIGRLGEMFNFLTVELERNINRMDLERAKLDTIFNRMVEGVVAIDEKGQLLHINDRAREMFGFPKELPVESISIDAPSLGVSNLNYQDASTLYGEGELTREGRHYRVLHAPFEDRELNVGGVILVYQDMTKERKLEEMRREFVANVSHELKTPITSIKSYTETLMHYPVDDETRHHFLQVIEHESDRMAHIVRDLLTLTVLDYKTEDKPLHACDASSIAHTALERMRMMATDKHQHLQSDLDAPYFVRCDPDDLLQVVINLISNAVKYTPEGGHIRVGTLREGSDIHLYVQDDGIGIPEKDSAHIFERFYRVEKSRSREMGGTGLGLAIAKEMIERMHGKILLSSIPDHGSTFTIVLPETDPPAASDAPDEESLP